MQTINQVVLSGRVGQPPSCRVTRGGVEVVRFTLATDRSPRPADGSPPETDWHTVVAFDRAARQLLQYVSRGDTVTVVGELRHDRWQDRDGSPRRITTVIARTVVCQGPRGERASLAAYPHKGADEPKNPTEHSSVASAPLKAPLPF